MKTENKIIAIIIAAILFYAFVQYMFQLSIMTGIGFVISCSLAFYKGVVFKEPRIIAYIAVGDVLINAATSQILPMVYQDLLQGSLLTAAIIFVVFLVVYSKGKELQSY